jgi:hypothetical protein
VHVQRIEHKRNPKMLDLTVTEVLPEAADRRREAMLLPNDLVLVYPSVVERSAGMYALAAARTRPLG